MKVILLSKKINSLDNEEEIIQSIKLLLSININNFRIVSPKDTKYKLSEVKTVIKSLEKKKDIENEYITVFSKSEVLGDVSQNALLKTLEESDYSIILITSSIDSLLPTIISRCQVINDIEVEEKIAESLDLNFNKIPQLSKLERGELINILSRQINSRNIDLALHYQDAIDKLNSNCKIESVLFNLVYQINKSYGS